MQFLKVILVCTLTISTMFTQTKQELAHEEVQQATNETEHPWWGLAYSAVASVFTSMAVNEGILFLLSFVDNLEDFCVNKFELTRVPGIKKTGKFGCIMAPIFGLIAYQCWKKAWASYFPSKKSKTIASSNESVTAGFALSAILFAHWAYSELPRNSLFNAKSVQIALVFSYGYMSYKFGKKTVESYMAQQDELDTMKKGSSAESVCE